ncbi:geranylgeranyl diphosphate synthase, type I [Actinopolyspora xinjiangensis]|uniref:Geranylgeranyl diphosphate synthase, type I n=1 Tax=Actinopolyspora xinjiangensis TaxID=405564 RepID=A0A1H0REJ0_9ACTN|nr:family 2 encapsulin nanocompartment cargo protein polyprenyl transferase [Actinopolyspora xinjiangensis]SDP28032.1 geranylgeranyl diphosphate synthase, type I [Actinopolyspora xinjiangensis]
MATVEDTGNIRSGTEILDSARELVLPALRTTVDRLPRAARTVATYHLGWCDEHGNPTDGRSGKTLRSALTLLAAEAMGGSADSAVPAAVAVELVHNFSLLHDDVIDGDETRRHRRTAWTVFGTGEAILAGDALLAAADDVLVSSEHPEAAAATRGLNQTVHTLIQGQSTDMDFERRHDVTLAECESMAAAKTGALLGRACALGAFFGGGTSTRIDRLRAFGEYLGLAFQHVDDLLGIWGDPHTTGKPVYSDLRARKKTLPVLAALNTTGPVTEQLRALYYREHPLSPRELARVAELVELAGGKQFSTDEADRLLSLALAELAVADTEPRSASELTELARMSTRRDR